MSPASATKPSSIQAASPDTNCKDVLSSNKGPPALKRAQIRHKRNPNDPNRIDDLDLVLLQTSTSSTTKNDNDSETTVNNNHHGRHHPPIVLDFAQPDHEMIRDSIFRLDSLFVHDADANGASDKKNNGENKPAELLKRNHQLEQRHEEEKLTSSNYYKGPMYGIKGFPGFVVAPNALHSDLKKQLAYEAVTTYCENPPYRTNLVSNNESEGDKHDNRQQQDDNVDNGVSMWEDWKQQRQQQQQQQQQQKSQQQHRQTKKAKKGHHKVDNRYVGSTKRRPKTLEKLSWATMGLHYDWTERSYNQQHKSPMPHLIGTLSRLFADTVASVSTNPINNIDMSTAPSSPPTPTIPSDFVPSAAIVNYYNTKSTMGAHRDDLEEALDQPIISISVGLPAIFVLGGLSRDDDDRDDNDDDANRPSTASSPQKAPVVTSILIRPGDVVIMSGPSRLRYHAMARVLPKEAATKLPTVNNMVPADRLSQVTLKQLLGEEEGGTSKMDGRCDRFDEGIECLDSDKDDMVFLEEYLEHHRININVRQVYPDDKWEDFVLSSNKGST